MKSDNFYKIQHYSGWGQGAKRSPTSFSPVTFTNVELELALKNF